MAIIVLPIINQYIEQVIIYDQNRAKINEFIDMIETVNDGITAIENKNELNFNDSIEIVEGTKILINESYIHYSLSIGDEQVTEPRIYKSFFHQKTLNFKNSFSGLLKIFLNNSKIQININAMN